VISGCQPAVSTAVAAQSMTPASASGMLPDVSSSVSAQPRRILGCKAPSLPETVGANSMRVMQYTGTHNVGATPVDEGRVIATERGAQSSSHADTYTGSEPSSCSFMSQDLPHRACFLSLVAVTVLRMLHLKSLLYILPLRRCRQHSNQFPFPFFDALFGAPNGADTLISCWPCQLCWHCFQQKRQHR